MRKKICVWAFVATAAVALAAGLFFLRRDKGTPVPVLMYHHFMEGGPSTADTVVSDKMLEQQIEALKEAGYHTITPQQLIAYVEEGAALPKKPILITMDDGYTSNLTIAAPIFEKYGMTATVFTIGINVGEENYVHSGQPLDPPRFSWEEARPWVDKGVMVVQSHTYDMHQRVDYGFSGRDGVLPLEAESEEDYRAALAADFVKARDGLQEGLGVKMEALAFPFGLNSPQAVEELEKLGVKVTFTTQFGCVRAVPGQSDSIRCMPRWGISDAITGQALVAGLEELIQQA